MGGKYEYRYFDDKKYPIAGMNESESFNYQRGYVTEYTNSWFKFMWIRLTKKVIYYKVYPN